MKKTSKKTRKALRIPKETICRLDNKDLQSAAGGESHTDLCPTMYPCC